MSIQQHHTLTQVSNAHWHRPRIHRPGMCPPGTSGICRLYAARGVVDGHGLLHELMADAIEDVSGQGSAGAAGTADSWLTVSSVTSEVCRDNAIGMLSYTCLGPYPSCMQTTHSNKTMLQHCVTTMLHAENAAFCSGRASQHPVALLNVCAALLSICHRLLPVCPCNRSLAFQAGSLLCHQISSVDKNEGN